ncbi:MAG: DUF5124 domain-containing protein [Bacteroides sp.]|nr:DUF5124 domain-containing protein [Bacteroides sp.]
MTIYSIYSALKFKALVQLTCIVAVFSACESLDNSITSDPYGGGKEALGIKLSSDSPSPADGYPGDTIVFSGKGFLDYCNPDADEYEFTFYIADVATPIQAATDTTLTVVVPENVCSGITCLVIDNQVFYGPNFPVLGNVEVDEEYGLYDVGTDDIIYDYLENSYISADHNYYLVGAYTSIGGSSFYGIGLVDEDGDVASKNSTYFDISKGLLTTDLNSSPYIRSISYFDDGQMLISGNFSAYESDNNSNEIDLGDVIYVNNIAVLEHTAFPDTTNYYFEENYNSKGSFDPVGLSTFNGGSKQTVLRSFITDNQQVIAVGNLTQYCTNEYASYYSLSEEVVTQVATVMRMNRDGTLDETYRSVDNGYIGVEGGSVNDAYMDENEGIVLVGDFTSFDGIDAPGIVRLDADGNVDENFLANIGSGIDGEITSVRYNAALDKAVLVGKFSTFNGQAIARIAIINADGTLDETFVPLEFAGGYPNFASIINKEKVIVSGAFTTYGAVPRPGFLILDMDGTATQAYNVCGTFSGQLQQVVEAETSIGGYGLLLMGEISRFNGDDAHNIVMLSANFD